MFSAHAKPSQNSCKSCAVKAPLLLCSQRTSVQAVSVADVQDPDNIRALLLTFRPRDESLEAITESLRLA